MSEQIADDRIGPILAELARKLGKHDLPNSSLGEQLKMLIRAGWRYSHVAMSQEGARQIFDTTYVYEYVPCTRHTAVVLRRLRF